MAVARVKYMFDLGNNKVANLSVVPGNYSGLKTVVGAEATPVGGVPEAKAVVATTREEAIAVGCFPIAVYYEVNNKLRRGIILCAPSKADTAISELKGQLFNAKKITKAMPPRRRKYVI